MIPRTVRSGIAFTDVIEPRETHSSAGVAITRVVDVSFASRRTFLADMLGYTSDDRVPVNPVRPNRNNYLLRRVPPEPFSPTWPWLYCVSADMVSAFGSHSFNDITGEQKYETARYNLSYQQLPYEVLADDPNQNCELYRYVERQNGQSVEALNGGLPGRFRFVDGGSRQPLPEGVPVILPSKSLKLIWHQIPARHLPFIQASIDSCIGKINTEPFDLFDNTSPTWPNTGHPRGTVLFMGIERQAMGRMNRIPQQELDPLTNTIRVYDQPDLYYNLTFNFIIRNNGDLEQNNARIPGGDSVAGWNYYLKPSDGLFYYATSGDDTDAGTLNGRPAYQYGDFNNMFRA